jgi:phosphonoacetate hydrolase
MNAGAGALEVEVNGRVYRTPTRPTLAITVDGCEPAYLDDALARGLMPHLGSRLKERRGAYWRGLAHMPTLTNPNNMSIVTGVAPAEHGISGNHCLIEGSTEPVQLVEPEFLRADTIPAAVQRVGGRVLCVTAKDKLRRLLGAGGVPSVSAERAASLSLKAFDIPNVQSAVGHEAPSMYEWDASHYALEIGLVAHRRRPIDLLYVSLTDFVQHKEAPRGAMADRFYGRLDELIGEYLAAGFVIGLTADHGMHAKPRVHFLEDELRTAGLDEFQVVLPITDPYVVHHGALGSFAWIYFASPRQADVAYDVLTGLPGVEEIYSREEAALIYGHPVDRIGDLSVSADASTALGHARARHDLTHVAGGLRSHGGRHEQIVPIVVSHQLTQPYADTHRRGVRNSDLFELLLNGVSESAS